MSLRFAVVLLLNMAVACGHSEDEWQAQLAKYAALEKQHKSLAGDLEQQQSRVRELSAQLETMGVKLSSEGSEKEKLSQDVTQMKARSPSIRRALKRWSASSSASSACAPSCRS